MLDGYYLEARYPTASEDVIPADFSNEQDAEQAIRMTQTVIERVKRYLEKEDGPEE